MSDSLRLTTQHVVKNDNDTKESSNDINPLPNASHSSNQLRHAGLHPQER